MKKTADRPPNLRRAYFESRFGQLHCRTAFPSTGGFDELTPLVGLHDAPGSGASLSAFMAAVRGQGAPLADGEDGARALDLALAVEQAIDG